MTESQEGGLVKISDFTKTSRKRRRRRPRGQTSTNTLYICEKEESLAAFDDASHDESLVNQSYNLLETSFASQLDFHEETRKDKKHKDVSIVNVNITQETFFNSTNSNETKQDNISLDRYATIYTEDIRLLLQLRIFNGQICKLKLHPDSYLQSHDFYSWIPVLVQVVPKGTFTNNERENRNELGHFDIYVPPMIACSMNLHNFGNLHGDEEPIKALLSSSIETECSKSLSSTLGSKDDAIDGIVTAKCAKWMEIAPPPSDYLPSWDNMIRSQDEIGLKRFREEEKERQAKNLQYYCIGRESKSQTRRLLTVGSMIAVVDDTNEHDYGSEYQRLRSRIRFYILTEVELPNQSTFTYQKLEQEHEDLFFWISSQTKLLLDPSTNEMDGLFVKRLPNLSTTHLFDMSLKNQHVQERSFKSMYKLQKHPNYCELVESIISAGLILTSGPNHISSLPHHLLHVIGSENNHLTECLDAVANFVGMNIVHISGLSAFTALKSLHQSNKNVTGSLMDKMSGVEEISSVTKNIAPCLLHICLDGEIIVTDDEESRHDEETRLLSCFQRQFLKSTSDYVSIPNLFIILSTMHELRNGPIKNSIIYDSIEIQSPNEEYAKVLWDNEATFEEVRDTIFGRTAKEILYCKEALRQSKSYQLQEMKPDFDMTKALNEALNSPSLMNVFRSTNKRAKSASLIPDVKWDDIGGLTHVRSEIMDAIELPLKHPELFTSLRAGLLFFGPPGTGKTLVAKAVASECGLPFLSVKGPELLGSYVGESESNIRKAFKDAREAASTSVHKDSGGAAILFFDEIDSLAPRRGGLGDGGGVMERVVSTLLSEMDSGSSAKNSDIQSPHIFVIGATNRPDLLDPALLRPGRFDRMIYLGLARERKDRVQILAAQMRKFRFVDGKSAHSIVNEVIDSIPNSLSGADFSSVASGALLAALQRVCDQVDRKAAEKQISVEDAMLDLSLEELSPMVSCQDIITAAKDVQPSVSEKEVERYEALKAEYCLGKIE